MQPASDASTPGRASPPLRTPLSFKKRALFFLLMIAGTYCVIEAISLVVIQFHPRYGGWSRIQLVMEGAAVTIEGTASSASPTDEVVHPYLGFVRQPTPGDSERNKQISNFGFRDRAAPLHVRRPDKIIVGILGGSVAEQFGDRGATTLKAELQKSPAFAGKEIVFVRLGLSGYKQPQQLLAVGYLLSLGGQFDILINLDGFNEVVLPIVENVPHHVFAGYPRSWHLRISQESDVAIMSAVGRIAYLKEQATGWARWARNKPFCYSATAALAWRVYHDRAAGAVSTAYRELNDLKASRNDFAASGPPQKFADEDELYEQCVQIWKRSSLQLHGVCQANGIRYYHFLQPNQYVPDSKDITEETRSSAWEQDYLARTPVEKGYPLLVREGGNLTAAGVSFTDLTQLFRDHPELIYKDACCHLNDHGNDLMAQKIAEVISHSRPGTTDQ